MHSVSHDVYCTLNFVQYIRIRIYSTLSIKQSIYTDCTDVHYAVYIHCEIYIYYGGEFTQTKQGMHSVNSIFRLIYF